MSDHETTYQSSNVEGTMYWDAPYLSVSYQRPITGLGDAMRSVGGGDSPVPVVFGRSWGSCLTTNHIGAHAEDGPTSVSARPCLGDTSQNLITRPSSGSTCEAGSYQP
jgi:hypothetical protein